MAKKKKDETTLNQKPRMTDVKQSAQQNRQNARLGSTARYSTGDQKKATRQRAADIATGSVTKANSKTTNSSTSAKKSSYGSSATSQRASNNTRTSYTPQRGGHIPTTVQNSYGVQKRGTAPTVGRSSGRGQKQNVLERTGKTLKGSVKQFAGGHLSSIGSNLQTQEVTARSIHNAKADNRNDSYKLRSRADAEKREQNFQNTINKKEGVDIVKSLEWRDRNARNPLKSIKNSATETAKAYNKARPDRSEQSYSLRSKEEAEKTRNSMMENIGRKEGVDIKNVERPKKAERPNEFPEFDEYSPSQKLIKTGDKLIESGSKDIERAKAGAGAVGRFLIDAGANATQMALDRSVGAIGDLIVPGMGTALSMGSLMNRAGGTASYEARQKGSDPDQQFRYGLGVSLVEGLSEGVFNSVSAFRSTYGAGAFDLADRVSKRVAASNIVRNYFNSPAGRSFIINASRLGAQGLEEGSEEVIADIIEPLLEKAITGSSDGIELKQMIYDFMVGAFMGAVPGTVDVARNVRTDSAIQNAMSEGRLNEDEYINRGLIQGRTGKNATNAELLAKELQEQKAQGKEVLPSQMRMLMEANAEAESSNTYEFRQRKADEFNEALKSGKTGTVERHYTAEEQEAIGRVRYQKEAEFQKEAKDRMGEDSSETSQKAVARVLSGSAETDDIDTILLDENARKAVEYIEKVVLPEDHAEAREVLENLAVNNQIANEDTTVSQAHDEIRNSMSQRNGEFFDEHYDEAIEALDVPNGAEIYDSVFSRLYTDGTVKESNFDESYDRIVTDLANRLGDEVGGRISNYFDKSFAEQIFNRGRDAMTEDNLKSAAKSQSFKYAETPGKISFEGNARKMISDRQADLLGKFAERANVHIKFMEKILTEDGGEANGMYKNGVIYIAANSDNKFIVVAKHELTHHLKATAFDAYKELEDFVFQKQYESNAEALENRIRWYQKNFGYTPEEAREEIIADASEAFFTDDGAIQDALSFSKKLGKAISDGIHTLLDTFISLQDTETDFSRRQTNAGDFLKTLDILKDAEQMWLKALNESANREKNTDSVTESELEAIEGKNLYSIKEGKARWTDSRIDQLIEEYGASHDDRYSKAYAVMMNPREFLKLTLSDESLGKWNESAKNMPDKLKGKPYRENVKNVHDERLETGVWIHDNENYPIDYEELARQKQTPFLEISSDNGTMVDGHEGRHRMRALMEAGVESVPVVIRDTDTKYTKDHVLSMALSSQDFGRGAVNNGARVILHNLIPIKQSNRDELIERFGGEADVKFSKKDQDYMDAVNRGDMETAQKMVDEEAKKHGLTSRLMHGTNSFGFTTVEYGKGDDHISFFATDNEEVASSYVRPMFDDDEPNTYVRSIGKPIKNRVNEQSPIGDIINALNKVRQSSYKVATEEIIKNEIDEQFRYVLEDAKELDRYTLPDKVQDVIEKVANSKDPQEAISLMDSIKDVHDIYYNDMLFYQATAKLSGLKSNVDLLKRELQWTPDNVGYWDINGHKNFVSKADVYEEYLDETGLSGRGIYELYASTNSPLTVYCNGSTWDNIKTTGEMVDDLGQTATTRQISKWAYDHGYRTVIFDYVRDTGKYGDRFTNPSTVYAFLEGGNNVIKSADPVTYDDNGEVIPLSERFNEKNEDIRYSRKEDQYEILQNANPMLDTYHTGIRSAKDIKNASEVFARKDFSGTPDWTYEDAQKALKNGKITVFSSKPIVNGAFVTPSMMEAESYAGEGNFYQAEVPIEDVAWIDSVEGQYAKVSNEAIQSEPKFSIKLMNHAAAKPVMDEGGKVVGARVFRDKNGDPLLMSGLEVTSETMRLMGKESKIPFVKRFLEKQARFMEKMGEKYTFIGLKDVSNADLEVRRDKNGKPVSIVVSAMVKNGEYPVNFDFSSICKKRQALSKLFEKLSTGENGEFLDSVELSVENLWRINEILSENGFETACLGCFVETKRYGIENWADTFAEKWNKAVLEKNPNAEYFNFASSKDIDFGYVSDEMDRFAENKKDEREKESKRRKKERASFIKKWLKNNPGESEANAEKAYKQWWKKAYNLKADQYKESWFENPALSNEKAIISLVNSGDKMQKLIRKTDLISPKGLKALMALHPDFYGVLYGHFGSGTPKPMVSFTPYNSEIALLGRQVNPNGGMKRYTPEANATLVNKLVEIGGVRIQSFSDFLIQNTFDYMQMVADMAARNFPAHAYTKEIAFAKIFGLTGIKINLSVMFDVDPEGIAPGLDKNGNYVVADKSRQEREKKNGNHVFAFSISYDEAVKLQNSKGYDGNVGIIGVGLSDLHIRKMLNDPDIKMVIPYHSSGMPAVIKQLTKLGADSDYTSTQNTLDISKIERDGVDVTKQYGKDYMLNLYKEKGSWKEAFAQFRKDTEGCTITPVKAFASTGNFPLYTGDPVMSLDATNDPKRTAEYYMGWCIENGHFPLFYQFADEENYYKVLYDFNVYHNDGTYAPQNAVENEYPEDLESVIEQYMKEANDFEQAQMPKWDNVINETKEMLKSNSYKEENGKFSRRESTSSETLSTQNTIAKLEEQVKDLKAEFKRTNLKTADQKDVRVQAGRLIQRHGSNMQAQTSLMDTFNKIFSLYKEKGTDAFDEVYEIAKDEAVNIVNNIGVIHNEGAEEYKAIKQYLRETPIQIDEAMKRNITDYNDFRKKNFGRLKLVNGETSNIDNVYMELAELFPAQFTEDYVNPHDQLNHIIDVLDNYAPFYESLDGASEEMQDYVVDIAADIMETAYNLQTKKTFADKKYEEKVKAVAKAREEALASRGRELEKQQKRYEKKLETLKAAVWEANERTAAERLRSEMDMQRLKEQQREKEQNKRERRAESEAKTKLLKIARRLDKYKTTEEMRKEIDSLIGDLDLVSKGMTSKTVDKLYDLAEWYENMKENDPDFIADEGIEKKLSRLTKKHIKDMTLDEVRDLYDVLSNIENELRTSKKFIDSEMRKEVKEAGRETIKNVNASKGIAKALRDFDGFFINGTLSPVRQIRRVTGYVDSDPLYIATKELADGQRKMLDYQMNSWKAFDRFMNDKKFIASLNGAKAQEIEVTGTVDGEPYNVKITPDIRMAMYLASKDNDNLRHIKYGGISLPDIKLYKKGKIQEAISDGIVVKFTPSQLREITSHMTEKEKQFADEAFKYFNETSPKAINETSEKLKGYSLAKVKNYFPIHTDTNFLSKDFDMVKFDGTIEGMGFLKERVKASNPIIMTGLVDTLTRSIEMNSKYVGLAIPVRNFGKLFGMKDVTYSEVSINGVKELVPDFKGAVQKSITKKWGDSVYNYIAKFVTDLQSGRRSSDDWENTFNKLRSRYAGAVLTLNASVAIKQAASYPTAAAVLGWSPLAKAMGNVGKVDLDLIAKYTPLQWYRSQGFSTTELGDIKSSNRKTLLEKVPALNWIQGMDVLTTRKLWKASEYYVRSHNKNLKTGTDEYYKAVADIYNRVIEETQPNYTTMQRPGLLRSDSSLVQMLNMFKTQPYQNFNILYDSIGNYVAKREQYRHMKNNETRQAFKNAGRDLRNSVSSQVAQLAVFAAMTSLWALFRRRDDKYKDEEGKLTFLSYLERLGKDMISNLFAVVPFGADIYGTMSSAITGEYYYGFTSVTDSSITDFLNAMTDGYKTVGEWIEYAQSDDPEKQPSKSLYKDTFGVVESASRFAGIPFSNMKNTWDGMFGWAAISRDGEYIGTYEAQKMSFAKDSEMKANLFKAYRNDKTAYNELRTMMIEDGFSEDSLDNYIKKQSKEHKSESEQKEYDNSMKTLEKSPIWKDASADDQKKFTGIIEKMSVGIEDSQTESITKKASGGLTEEQVILYKLALKKVDKPNSNGNLGTYTKDEKNEAIKLLEKEYKLTWSQKETLKG